MSTKSRFGFFSIPPSHTAAKTDCTITKSRKDQEGKVLTESRGIYSGTTSTGVLRKGYFSVPKSIYQGDPYDKPRKSGTIAKSFAKTQTGDQEVFKPAMLNKTLCSASYPYVCENPFPKDPKSYRT